MVVVDHLKAVGCLVHANIPLDEHDEEQEVPPYNRRQSIMYVCGFRATRCARTCVGQFIFAGLSYLCAEGVSYPYYAGGRSDTASTGTKNEELQPWLTSVVC